MFSIFKKNYIPKFPGCLPDIPDENDYIYENICGTIPIDWERGYKIDPLKVEDQNGSSSCVGQAWAKYLENLEREENKVFTDLSAKFIYSQINLVGGGAYLRDGAKIAVKQGCCLESVLPSYPATETHMSDSRGIIGDVRDNAKVYKSKFYASIKHKNNIDTVAQTILQNYGSVTGVYGTSEGWRTKDGWVRLPRVGENVWGHAIYLTDFGIFNSKKYIKFINSWGTKWGENGYGYLSEDYFKSGNVFSLWTLVDSPNPSDPSDIIIENMPLKIIGNKQNGKQYVEGKDGILHWIVNGTALDEYHNCGIVDKNTVEWKDNLDGYEIGRTFGVLA